MAKVVWRPRALGDLDDIVDFIEQFDPKAADAYLVKLRRCGDSLADFPARGRPAAQGRREMTNVPPYILTYEVDGDTVHVLSIRHGARRPID